MMSTIAKKDNVNPKLSSNYLSTRSRGTKLRVLGFGFGALECRVGFKCLGKLQNFFAALKRNSMQPRDLLPLAQAFPCSPVYAQNIACGGGLAFLRLYRGLVLGLQSVLH